MRAQAGCPRRLIFGVQAYWLYYKFYFCFFDKSLKMSLKETPAHTAFKIRNGQLEIIRLYAIKKTLPIKFIKSYLISLYSKIFFWFRKNPISIISAPLAPIIVVLSINLIKSTVFIFLSNCLNN